MIDQNLYMLPAGSLIFTLGLKLVINHAQTFFVSFQCIGGIQQGVKYFIVLIMTTFLKLFNICCIAPRWHSPSKGAAASQLATRESCNNCTAIACRGITLILCV